MMTLFLAALGVGILWALWIPQGGLVRPGYYAWMVATAFAVLTVMTGLAWTPARGLDPWLAGAAAGALTGRILMSLGFHRIGLGLACLAGAACLGHLLPGTGPFAVASVVLSALVLGATIDAMVLGHWYLVQHGLSFQPLERMGDALLGLYAIRTVLAAAWLWAMGGWERLTAGEVPLDRWMFLLLRGLAGLVGPLALGWMVRECVKLKSNTSATGILYVICLFVLVGEFTAVWFWTSLGAWI